MKRPSAGIASIMCRPKALAERAFTYALSERTSSPIRVRQHGSDEVDPHIAVVSTAGELGET